MLGSVSSIPAVGPFALDSPGTQSYRKLVMRQAPPGYILEVIPPTQQGTWHFGGRIIPIPGSKAPSGKPYSGYEIWRKWEDCVELDVMLEKEFVKLVAEKRKGQSKANKGALYRAERAASFESLPSGPESMNFSPDIHSYLPRISRKLTLFRPTTALVEQRTRDFQALMESLFGSDAVILRELLHRTSIRDWFGFWLRDKDNERKVEVPRKSLALNNMNSSSDLSTHSSTSGSSGSSTFHPEAGSITSPPQSRSLPSLHAGATAVAGKSARPDSVVKAPPPIQQPYPPQSNGNRYFHSFRTPLSQDADDEDLSNTIGIFPMPPTPTTGESSGVNSQSSSSTSLNKTFRVAPGATSTSHNVMSSNPPHVVQPRSLPHLMSYARRNHSLPPSQPPPNQPLPDIPPSLPPLPSQPVPDVPRQAVPRIPRQQVGFPSTQYPNNRQARIFLSAPNTPKKPRPNSDDTSDLPQMTEDGSSSSTPPTETVRSDSPSSVSTISTAVSRRRSFSQTSPDINMMRASSPLPLGLVKEYGLNSYKTSLDSNSDVELAYATPRLPSLHFSQFKGIRASTSTFNLSIIGSTGSPSLSRSSAASPPPFSPSSLRRSFSSGSRHSRSESGVLSPSLTRALSPRDEEEPEFEIVAGQLTEEFIDSYFNLSPKSRSAFKDDSRSSTEESATPPYSPLRSASGGRESIHSSVASPNQFPKPYQNRPPGQFHLPFSMYSSPPPPICENVSQLPETLTVKAIYSPADCIIVFRSPRVIPLEDIQEKMKVKFYNAEQIDLDWVGGEVVLGFQPSSGNKTPTTPTSPLSPLSMTSMSSPRGRSRSDSVTSSSSSGDSAQYFFITTQADWEQTTAACRDKVTLHILDSRECKSVY